LSAGASARSRLLDFPFERRRAGALAPLGFFLLSAGASARSRLLDFPFERRRVSALAPLEIYFGFFFLSISERDLLVRLINTQSAIRSFNP